MKELAFTDLCRLSRRKRLPQVQAWLARQKHIRQIGEDADGRPIAVLTLDTEMRTFPDWESAHEKGSR